MAETSTPDEAEETSFDPLTIAYIGSVLAVADSSTFHRRHCPKIEAANVYVLTRERATELAMRPCSLCNP